jgi:hypothetical protein
MNALGFGFVFLFALLLIGFLLLARRKGARPVALRDVEAFNSLPRTVGQAVETGKRLHVSLGAGAMGDVHSATALVGLAVLDQVSDAAVISDRPPVVTTADGLTALLAEDTLRNVYKRKNALNRYDPTAAQVAGLDSNTLSAAITGLTTDEAVAGTIVIGSVGTDAALIAEAGRRANATTLAGSDDPTAQAVLFATADQPLIGEDLFAGGAYIVNGLPAHIASLRAQDIARIGLIIIMVLGALGASVGLIK